MNARGKSCLLIRASVHWLSHVRGGLRDPVDPSPVWKGRYSWTFCLSQASLRTSVANILVEDVKLIIVEKAGPSVSGVGPANAASTGFQRGLMIRPARKGRGNVPVISVAGFETSYNTWSSSKRAYCCAHFQMGCKVMNYDCSVSWRQVLKRAS